METADFVFAGKEKDLDRAAFKWRSPSNIALVKYWGKKGDQIPANASLSFTLSECSTETSVLFEKRNGEPQRRNFFFEGKENPEFGKKSFSFFDQIRGFAPYLQDYHITVRTENTFPHSSGIASSASGMSALALCVMSLEKALRNNNYDEVFFYRKASFLARIGSGSASRSVYGGAAVWGAHDAFASSSDQYAVPFVDQLHPDFKSYRDVILIVHGGKKSVSSTAGHSALEGNPFAQTRFNAAQNNMAELKRILAEGDLTGFCDLIEKEALMLHALMMTGKEPFILMKPETLAVMEKIRTFRAEADVPVCFTLDAGANVHVLFPEKFNNEVMNFIVGELVPHCENKRYICDFAGNGPEEYSL